MTNYNKKNRFTAFLITNAVPILFIVFSALSIPLAGLSGEYLVQEMVIRLARYSFLVLSLLIPVIAGMGLNFGIVLGAMAGQIGLIFVSDWQIVGLQGMLLAMILSIPLALFLGWMAGLALNRAKGREMVTSYILGFFINGVYQLLVLYGMGAIIPISNNKMLLPRGYGIRNAIDLVNIRGSLDNLIPLEIFGIQIPLATFLSVAGLCIFIVWFRRTKLGQDMRAIGQDMEVAANAGIPVERTRILSIVISTLLAAFGQIIFLQNIGTMNTYNSHEQIGMFSIAALLVGGASVAKASLPNAFVGIILFHIMFVVSPRAGKTLMGEAQIGEYFRVFISYGIIAIALVLHAWRQHKDRERARMAFRGDAQAKSTGE
ncbi:MAG TPA: ABC transporter permease [Thermotogota bacterium]|nr:ABC transporter permease [Thermotogota bacterium]HRW92085.1 ABC transporter permease [Thermotogota bacterium]